jgi:L-seryl-tRNA(Ser) seleniumtransferase
MGIYEELGVKRIINCVSTTFPLGSSVTYPEVMDAMKEASTHFVAIDQLQEKAGAIIAEMTGSEAAIVTCGCSAALTMAAAACIMKGTPLEKYRLSGYRPPREEGEWLTWMQRLPDTEGLRNEIIHQRGHLNQYSQALRVAGAKLVLVGTAEECRAEDVEGAITDRTAAIAFTGMYSHRGLPLEDVLRIAKKHGIPVIMDAAYTLPPRSNLRRWASMGVDLVCYSGGKAIRGPSDTGILCGRRDLVNLAAVQMSPHHGVGRGLKVDKTQIVGLLKALQIFAGQDDATEFAAREVKARYIINALKSIPTVSDTKQVVPTDGLLRGWPVVTFTLDEGLLGMSTREVVELLYAGNPGIWVYYDHVLCPGGIAMNTENLLEGEEQILTARLRAILGPR